MIIKNINYILIAIGGITALYANAKNTQSEYLLIIGIVVLMLGVYRLSRTIPSRNSEDENVDDFKDSQI